MNGLKRIGRKILPRLIVITAGVVLPQVTVDCQAAANQFAAGFFSGLGFRAAASATSSGNDGGDSVCIGDCS
ncbi:MAG TPA: hypothetical protein VGM03_08350 [Phycisphaerae bacterium]|jgi:hypothetical protein